MVQLRRSFQGQPTRARKRRVGQTTKSSNPRINGAPLQRQELGRLHLVQTRDGAREFVGQRAFGVELLGRHLGRHHQLDAAVVQHGELSRW